MILFCFLVLLIILIPLTLLLCLLCLRVILCCYNSHFYLSFFFVVPSCSFLVFYLAFFLFYSLSAIFSLCLLVVLPCFSYFRLFKFNVSACLCLRFILSRLVVVVFFSMFLLFLSFYSGVAFFLVYLFAPLLTTLLLLGEAFSVFQE